jgi:hypothetical protein
MADVEIMTQLDVVFTALYGGYESLNELSINKNPDTKYICFTDDPTLMSETWEVRVFLPKKSFSPSRSSREIKMLGHKFFPEGTRSLYIDNTVRLKVDGKEILDEWLVNAEIAFMQHYSRRTVRGEFFACSAYGLDDQSTIRSQFQYYRKHFKHVLKQKPHWGGMIARTNTASTDLFMETWKKEFDSFTRRDQLSINVSSVISGVRIKTVQGENNSSKWHEWPIHTNRRVEMRGATSTSRFRKCRILINAVRYGIYFYLIP